MGYAVRTDRYRYVRWQDWETKQVVAQELYDHQTDPNEMFNLADRPEHAPIVHRLNDTLDDGSVHCMFRGDGCLPIKTDWRVYD